MTLHIKTQFSFKLPCMTDILLQFEAAHIPEQRVLSSDTQLTPSQHQAWVPAQDAIGERIWVRAEGTFEVAYQAEVDIQRQLADLATLEQLAPHDMPGEVVQYLFDSRFIPADRFQTFVQDEFGGTQGGARIVAIRDWLEHNFVYTPGVSGPETGALDTFVERRGVCRDYSHVLVAMARASGIPARYVACYAPGVEPPDFHAIAEVFLDDPEAESGGTWQLVDGTGMADPAQTVKIGVGRDAADISFLTSFGRNEFIDKTVHVKEA